jgi:type II secretory pathway pseudopilin PulG
MNLSTMEPLVFSSSPLLKRSFRQTAAFSLVEVTLALGVAAFCLIALLGLVSARSKSQQASIQQITANDIITEIDVHLRADVRLPPGQASNEQISGFGLHGHCAQLYAPDTLFFSSDAQVVGGPYSGTTDPPAPTGATFRAKITYLSPPNTSTSAANVVVSWPAQILPTTGTPAGWVETFIAVNR